MRRTFLASLFLASFSSFCASPQQESPPSLASPAVDVEKNVFQEYDTPSEEAIEDFTLAGLLGIIKNPHTCEDLISAGKELTSRMESLGITELFLGEHSHAYVLGREPFTLDDFRRVSHSPLVASLSSPALTPILGVMQEFVYPKEKSYVLFTPNLLNCVFKDSSLTSLAGMASHGLIFIDTFSQESGPTPLLRLPSLLAHEIEHHHNRDYGLPLLETERMSIIVELSNLEAQYSLLEKQCQEPFSSLDIPIPFPRMPLSLACKEYSSFSPWIMNRRAQLYTAEYLRQDIFHGVFSSVYPWGKITAQHLLEAQIPETILSQYAFGRTLSDSEKDKELKIASYVALLAKKSGENDRILTLYELVQDPMSEPLFKENAVAVLSYFNPIAFSSPKILLQGFFVPPLETLFFSVPMPSASFPPPYQEVPYGNSIYTLDIEFDHPHPLIDTSLQILSKTFKE